MSKNIKPLSNEELFAAWSSFHALSETAYQRMQELSALEAEYNRREYLGLARTPEGKAQYNAQIASFRSAMVTSREAFRVAIEAKIECKAEMALRGMP
jgi:hypothetical protein